MAKEPGNKNPNGPYTPPPIVGTGSTVAVPPTVVGGPKAAYSTNMLPVDLTKVPQLPTSNGNDVEPPPSNQSAYELFRSMERQSATPAPRPASVAPAAPVDPYSALLAAMNGGGSSSSSGEVAVTYCLRLSNTRECSMIRQLLT